MYDVYLYLDADDDALTFGSDELVRDFPTLRGAIEYANGAVEAGRYERAIVGEGENVIEHYDTVESVLPSHSGEYVVAIDDVLDAVWIRDVLLKAVEDHWRAFRKTEASMLRSTYGTREYTRASNATAEHERKAEVFERYAERFEDVRKQEAEKVKTKLGIGKKP